MQRRAKNHGNQPLGSADRLYKAADDVRGSVSTTVQRPRRDQYCGACLTSSGKPTARATEAAA